MSRLSYASQACEIFWDVWMADANRAPSRLDNYVTAVIDEFHGCLATHDWDTASELWNVFQAGESLCTEEPYASVYDRGLMGIVLLLAETKCEMAEYREAIMHAQRVLDCMQVVQARQQRLGITFRPYTAISSRCYGLLALAKWEGPAHLRDTACTPSALIEAFNPLAERAVWGCTTGGIVTGKAADQKLAALAINELDVCAMVARYLPKYLDDTVAAFNRHHGLHLSAVPGHYRLADPVNEGSAYYWKFEIAKLYLANEHTAADVEHCGRMYRQTVAQTYRLSYPQAIEYHWERFYLLLKQRIGRNFRVLEA